MKDKIDDMATANRRLVFVITEGKSLWQQWIELAKAARDAGYNVTVVTRAAEHGDAIRESGLDLVDIDFYRGRLSPWTNLRTLLRLRAIYRRFRPHLVHHFAMQPIVLGTAAAALSGKPAVVNTVEGMGHLMVSNGMGWRFLRRALLPVLGLALRRSHTVVQNPDDAALVRSLGAQPGRVAVIRGVGVDIRKFTPAPEPQGRIRITMVSRMLWSKGVGEFVDAASAVRAIRDDVVFTLVGEPDERNPASVPAEQLSAWASAGIVDWWGYRQDIANVWTQSHIAVLPSYYREGLPTSLLEAMSCGRPVVTTDMPGCREAVNRSENGLLVPARDARALADAIVTLVDDRTRRVAMGAAGRRLVETTFTLSHIHEETLRVYERALNEH